MKKALTAAACALVVMGCVGCNHDPYKADKEYVATHSCAVSRENGAPLPRWDYIEKKVIGTPITYTEWTCEGLGGYILIPNNSNKGWRP